jgi:hypothetical protein
MTMSFDRDGRASLIACDEPRCGQRLSRWDDGLPSHVRLGWREVGINRIAKNGQELRIRRHLCPEHVAEDTKHIKMITNEANIWERDQLQELQELQELQARR